MANELPQSFSFSLPDEENKPLPESFSFSIPEGAGAAKPKVEHEGILSKGPEDSAGRSAAKFLGTMALKGAAGIPGIVGDLAHAADFVRTGVKSYIQDRPQAQIQQEEAAARKKAGTWEFPTTEEIYSSYIAPHVGEYKPESTLGKTLMSAGEGAIGMLGPGGVIGTALRAAKAAPTAATKAAARNAELIKGLTAGAVGGGAATAATEMTDNPLAGLAAGLIAPTAIGVHTLRTDPTRQVRKEVTGYMAEPAETKAKIAAYEPGGMRETTAVLTGDPGLALAQHDLASSSKSTADFRGQLAAANATRNEEIMGLLSQAAKPDANPMDVVNALRSEHGNILGQLEEAKKAIPANVDPVAAIQEVRKNTLDRLKEASGRTSAMYKSLDEGGTGVTPLDNIKKGVAKIQSEYDFGKHGPMDPAIATIVGKYNPEKGVWEGGMAQSWGDNMRYLDAVELDKTLEGLRQQLAVQPGKKYERGQVANLKDLIKDDFDATTGMSSGQNARQGLAAAKAHHIMVKDIYDNEFVRGALKTDPFGKFTMGDVLASQKFFRPGPEGRNAAEAWLRAAGPDRDAAVTQLENIATAALGTKDLTPQAIQNWKNKYRDAISVIENERPGFSSKFDNFVDANNAVKELQGTVAAKLLGVSDPSQVTQTVGEMLINKKAGPSQWQDMLAPIQDPAAKQQAVEALRKSGVDYITRKFYDDELRSISGASLRKFLNQNEANLSALYGDQFSNMKKVADELSRGQQVSRAGIQEAGSATGYNTRAQVQRKPPESPTLLALANASALGYLALPGLGAASGPIAYFAQKWMAKNAEQRMVIRDQMIADAMLKPEVAKALLDKPTAESLRILSPYLALGTAGVARGSIESEKGEPAWTQYNPYIVGKTPTIGEKLITKAGQLNPFKRGGAVRTLDHGAKAEALIRMADKAKKQHNSTTEPLLNQPDEVITKALALADEAI